MLFVSHHVNESDAPAVKDDEPSGTLILTVWAETMNHEPKLVPFCLVASPVHLLPL